MNYDKYVEEIHQKYLPKVQYAIDIMNSCKNESQLHTCCCWVKGLFLQWSHYEDRLIDEDHGAWTAANMSSRMNRELSKLVDVFHCVRERKKKELSEPQEF